MIDIHTLAATTLANGGATTNLAGEVPTSGYAVALPGAEVIVSATDDLASALDAYVAQHADILATVGNFLGSWVDGASVYLDTSTVYTDRAAAVAAGQASDQLAIFDLSTGSTITL